MSEVCDEIVGHIRTILGGDYGKSEIHLIANQICI